MLIECDWVLDKAAEQLFTKFDIDRLYLGPDNKTGTLYQWQSMMLNNKKKSHWQIADNITFNLQVQCKCIGFINRHKSE